MGELREIPGVGKQTEKDLVALGYSTIASLKHADPQVLYDQECLNKGMKVDRCVLYVYRLAVYYATHTNHDPQKLKWWYWKDCNAEKEGEI